MPATINLDGKLIGPGHPPYVLAEISGNHNGSIERAKAIITAAAEAGAHGVKLQTYTAATMTIRSERPEFRITGGLWDGYTLWDLYEWAHTPYEWHGELFAHARACGISCISTPFDESAVDLLEGLNAPYYKVASFEMTDHPLVKRIAQTGKPMIMSTGMANRDEIAASLEVARKHGSGDILLLHCISGYPTPVGEANLLAIPDLAREFETLVGLSDHTMGNTAAITSIALGASLIEKHFTLSRADGGPDADFSMEPAELKTLVSDAASAHSALGTGGIRRTEFETGNLKFRRSIYVVEPVRKGEPFTTANIRRIRPGFGLAPERYETVLRSVATRDIESGTPLSEEMLGDK
ncbi:MAG: pseudaminic acid synthase [Rhizobiaceae bacterium]